MDVSLFRTKKMNLCGVLLASFLFMVQASTVVLSFNVLTFSPSKFTVIIDFTSRPEESSFILDDDGPLLLEDLISAGVDAVIFPSSPTKNDLHQLETKLQPQSCIYDQTLLDPTRLISFPSNQRQVIQNVSSRQPSSLSAANSNESSRSSTSAYLTFWELSGSSDEQIQTDCFDSNGGIGHAQEEAFLICGNTRNIYNAINNNLPANSACLWRPPIIDAKQEISFVDVWRLRSNPGIVGIVLSWTAIQKGFFQTPANGNQLRDFYSYVRKLKQPCSAMDYPPTIFMVGEDEIS